MAGFFGAGDELEFQVRALKSVISIAGPGYRSPARTPCLTGAAGWTCRFTVNAPRGRPGSDFAGDGFEPGARNNQGRRECPDGTAVLRSRAPAANAIGPPAGRR